MFRMVYDDFVPPIGFHVFYLCSALLYHGQSWIPCIVLCWLYRLCTNNVRFVRGAGLVNPIYHQTNLLLKLKG